jgi:hypothetical protein
VGNPHGPVLQHDIIRHLDGEDEVLKVSPKLSGAFFIKRHTCGSRFARWACKLRRGTRAGRSRVQGGLFSDDPETNPAGEARADIKLTNAVIGPALTNSLSFTSRLGVPLKVRA